MSIISPTQTSHILQILAQKGAFTCRTMGEPQKHDAE